LKARERKSPWYRIAHNVFGIVLLVIEQTADGIFRTFVAI
jgi:hypothetical protein